MRLQINTSFATGRGAFMVGQVVNVDRLTAEHQAWIRQGMATLIRTRDPEQAVATPVERAVLPQRRAVGRRAPPVAR